MLNIELSRISYPETVHWLAPVIPGGVLVTGVLLTRNPIEAAFYGQSQIAPGAKVAIALFAVYVSGFVLSNIVRIIEYLLGYALGYWAGSKQSSLPQMEPSTNKDWRRAARKLIGDDLAPSTDEVYNSVIHETAKKVAEAISDNQARQEALWNIELHHLNIRISDGEWYRWYQILKQYFDKPNPDLAVGLSTLLTLQTTGWVGIILLLITPLQHWFIWAICIISIILGFAGEIAQWAFGTVGDQWGHKLTADILQEVKSREAGTSSASSAGS
jgi:hypothetical protein